MIREFLQLSNYLVRNSRYSEIIPNLIVNGETQTFTCPRCKRQTVLSINRNFHNFYFECFGCGLNMYSVGNSLEISNTKHTGQFYIII